MKRKLWNREISQDSIPPLSKLASVSSDIFSKDMFQKESISQLPIQPAPLIQKLPSSNEKVTVDPITVMQIAVIYKKDELLWH